jgi:DNA-binding NtrC family response regulator
MAPVRRPRPARSLQALARTTDYASGNVRELENFVERAAILHAGATTLPFDPPLRTSDEARLRNGFRCGASSYSFVIWRSPVLPEDPGEPWDCGWVGMALIEQTGTAEHRADGDASGRAAAASRNLDLRPGLACLPPSPSVHFSPNRIPAERTLDLRSRR